MSNVITLQSGLREYTQNLQPYTGMLGGLTPDVHTLRALNPLTTNRVLVVMYRVPWFLLQYFGGAPGGNAYADDSPIMTYKKCLEFFNQGVQCNMGDGALTPANYQGGFAGRSISIPTTQNTQGSQSLTITVSEMVGRPIANVHNMWVDGISDPITGLTHYQGLVAGSVDKNGIYQRIFKPNSNQSDQAFEPSPAYEVAEFLVMALDRSGARCEAAALALGCYPAAKLNGTILNSNATGSSQIEQYQIQFNCQFVQSTFVNDIANRYVKQFAIFGNSMNLNPGVGDAFFKNYEGSTKIDTNLFHEGERPDLDAVQSGMGNAPVFNASADPVLRDQIDEREIGIRDHSLIRNSNNDGTARRLYMPPEYDNTQSRTNRNTNAIDYNNPGYSSTAQPGGVYGSP